MLEHLERLVQDESGGDEYALIYTDMDMFTLQEYLMGFESPSWNESIQITGTKTYDEDGNSDTIGILKLYVKDKTKDNFEELYLAFTLYELENNFLRSSFDVCRRYSNP